MKSAPWRLSPALGLVGVVLLAGCEYYPTQGDAVPGSIQIVEGDRQTRSAGRPVWVAPTVKVTDAHGLPAAGVKVEFVARGSARVTRGETYTNEAGIATVGSWSLRTDGGTDTLVARVANGRVVSFTATASVFSALAVSGSATCGLVTGGVAVCWGQDQLGLFARSDSVHLRPAAVPTDLRFKKLALGSGQFCGLTLDGLVYCNQEDGSGSRLIEVGQGQRFVDLASNPYESLCAIDSAGTGYCWGRNLVGGSNPPRPLPASSNPPLRQIAAGVAATVFEPATMLCALSSEGRVSCYYVFGGLRPFSDAPVSQRFQSIAVTGFFGCGIEGTDAWCWGALTPLGHPYPERLVKVAIPPVLGLSASDTKACGITVQGVYCWGDWRPIEVIPGSADHRFVQLAVGQSHSCALDPSGAAWCWGANQSGQLGNDTTAASTIPVRVLPDL